MAFGVSRSELNAWKSAIQRGEVAFLTHFWIHPKYPQFKTVTKVGCCNIEKLEQWGEHYGLLKEWIHYTPYPHFDLIGKRQFEILKKEGIEDQIDRFQLDKMYSERGNQFE